MGDRRHTRSLRWEKMCFWMFLSADLYIIDIPSSCNRILLVPSFPSPNGGVVPATPLQQWNALQQSHVSVTMSEALLQKATIEQVMLAALKCCGQEDATDSAEPLFLTFLMQECFFSEST